MAGNRIAYQQAIKKAHSAAWDKKWLKAIDEYHRALQEFPEDFETRQSLALVLEEAGQLEGALAECQRALQLRPNEAAALTRMATLQEKLGRNEDAVATFLKLAQVHVENRSRGKAVEAWHKAASLAPDRVDAHQQLADIYEKAAHHSLAAKEYLALARIYQKQGEPVQASQSAQRALELDPQSPSINEWIASTRTAKPTAETSAPNPVDEAQQTAIARLADTLLDDRSAVTRPSANAPQPEVTLTKPEIDALIARAIDAQTHRRVPDAITSYRKLIAGGVTRSEVKFNLGLLYVETMRYDDAIRLLRETASDPSFALASHYELGKSYRVLGNLDKALEHFLAVTKIVDLGSVQREQADELISVYQELANSYSAKGDRKKADEYNHALQEFLVSKGWADKVDQVREQVEVTQTADQEDLGELNSPDASRVLKSLSLAQEYLRRDKLRAAGEECLRAIELAPNYLPAHVRMADVLVKEGRIEDAKQKYQAIAEVALARGDAPRAENLYRQLLKIAPDDVMGRSKLIDIALQQGRIDEVLQQYFELGDDYARKGDHAKAAERFAEGMRLASRQPTKSQLLPTLQHRFAEAVVKSGDFRRSLAAYQEIKQQYPEDERARLMVIDLQLRQGQVTPALRELDELIKQYQSKSQVRQAASLVDSLIQSYPDQAELHSRLAEIHILAGNAEKAVEALDVLGELQLSRGQRAAAAETIRKIIAINPPRVEDYHQLLQQLETTTP